VAAAVVMVAMVAMTSIDDSEAIFCVGGNLRGHAFP